MKYKRDIHMKFEVLRSLLLEIVYVSLYVFMKPLYVSFMKIVIIFLFFYSDKNKGSFGEIYSQRLTKSPGIEAIGK